MAQVKCSCGVPVHDGYMCSSCTAALRETIRSAPLWADQLGLVLARLVRYTDPAGRTGASAPLPYNPAASTPARTLDAVLRATSQRLGAPDTVRTARLGVVAQWVAGHVDNIRVHPEGTWWAAAITSAVATAVRVCDRPPEQWYAGACEDCGTHLYPRAVESTVTCPCGKAWSVADRRAELLAAVRDTVAPGPVIAAGLSAFSDRPVSEALLRMWRHRGRLEVRRTTTAPATNWYRVGDVLDLLTSPDRQRKAR